LSHIFIPANTPEDWQRFLAVPERQWRDGSSAKRLAYSWHTAANFPPEISQLLTTSDNPAFHHVERLFAFPEYKVALPGGGRASQCDLFVIGKAADNHLIAITVEGKVNEPFGPRVTEWRSAASSGKQERLTFMAKRLGIDFAALNPVRYQLLHRTVVAVLEAERLSAPYAISLVHSFSQTDKGFTDFQAFVALFGRLATANQLVELTTTSGIHLYTGWARGNPVYARERALSDNST
jgi:hypothetical protein